MKNFFSRLLISLAYYLRSNTRYQKRRRFFYNLLENDNYKYKHYFDYFMIFLIFVSVFVLIREVRHHVDDALMFINNIIISLIFFVEYLLRLWVNGSITKIILEQEEHDTMLSKEFDLKKALKRIVDMKVGYMLTPKAIVDLLAVLPFFHELRLLRLFVLFRVFKIFRYTKSFTGLVSVLASKKFEFFTLFLFASVVIFISSVLIYVLEGNNPESHIKNFFSAFYWSIVTLSTVGFGDITPVSDEGRFVTIFIIISGVGVLSFFTSLIVSAFNERLDEFKEAKMIENITKLKKIYLICGYDSIAREVAKEYKFKSKNIIVLDNVQAHVENAKNDGLEVFLLNPGSVKSYEKLQIDFKKQVAVVMCLAHDDVENVYTALTVRYIDKDVRIISLLMNDANKKKLEFAKVNDIIYPQELIGMITRELVGQPVAFEAIHALRSENSIVKIDEIVITEPMLEHYSYVHDLGNKRYRIVLLGVYKKRYEKFWFNPIDSTLLEAGDILLVIGYAPFIVEFEKHLMSKDEDE